MGSEENAVPSRNQRVPRLCYGTLAISPLQRAISPGEGSALLLRAYERGITIVDTAEYYETYGAIKSALEQRPDIFVITKSYAYDRDGAEASVRKALDGIGRGHIDMFLMHEQESEWTVRGHVKALEYYRSMKNEGVIGSVGLSTHRIEGVRAAIKYGMDAVMAPLNIEGIGLTDGSREEMERALADAHDAGMTVIVMKALAGGHMIVERERAFEYVMSLPFVDFIAVGMASEAEIDYNTAVFRGELPSEESAKESIRMPRTLMIEEGCIGCGRCAERCGQGAIVIREGIAEAIPGKCVRCGYCARVCPMMCIKVL